ncbi:chorismate mutase [Nakamurella alba]|nr:chorismate mutase [Nakamurella alba]
MTSSTSAVRTPVGDRPATGPAARGMRHVSEPAPLPEIPVPSDQDGIDLLRVEIDAADAEIVRLIQRRTALSQAIGQARKSLGGPRIVYSREMAILDRFRALGPAGTDLGMLLLAMGRGKLGRK